MACENVLASQEVSRLRCARGGLVALRTRWFGCAARAVVRFFGKTELLKH